jgi:hypothetical protein
VPEDFAGFFVDAGWLHAVEISANVTEPPTNPFG